MLVTLPCCQKDIALAERNLDWCLKLDQRSSFECLIACEQGADTTRLQELAKSYFRVTHHFTYDRYTGEPEWPNPQCYAWQSVARYVADHFKTPWLWWESDATPLKPRWLDSIAAEYYKAGLPFMGHIVPKMGWMNGVAVYPNNIALHSTDALLCRKTAFDVMLWKDIKTKTHPANHLIAHFPRYNGIQLAFKEPQAVMRLLDKGYVLFHGCNDGSLIDLLLGQQPAESTFRRIVRFFTVSDVNLDVDESEAMWQREAGDLSEKGYPVLPYADCSNSVPSVLKQRSWPAGIFPLPLDYGQCYFNPTIVQVRGATFLITRHWRKDGHGHWHSRLVRWKLDDEFYPSEPMPLVFPRYSGVEQIEDPRAIVHENKIWISHCTWRHGRIYRAHQSLTNFTLDWQWAGTMNIPYGGNGLQVGQGSAHEKNWVWLNRGNRWHFVYSFQPHMVVEVIDTMRVREHKSAIKPPVPWQYGQIRGGTPPVKVGDEYVTFFHSSLAWQGRKKRYYCGAYAFQAQPPFAVTRMTKEYLLCGSDQDTRILDGPLVTFPGGAIFNDGLWTVVFGCNDEASGWVRIPHDELLTLMATV